MSIRRGVSYREVLKVARKPSRKELWLYTKLTLLGIGVLGALAFIIRLLFTYIWLSAG